MRRTGKLNFEADFSNGGNFQSKEQSSSGEVEYIFHLLYICKSMYSIFRITTFNMQIYPKSVTFQSCNQHFFGFVLTTLLMFVRVSKLED